ncbi:hypothetical protein GUITHDRAFT_115022 [Guillardia theta CCMP2712]|uniref:COX assembly mitochondrial protein n=1 Tax=Guillardia theta (strain CCMP2712) TaxID=905079 RepID=L1ISP1_GUITC|nr:hypothetical protein GUITHDRAFT_115022 [Guillardia theta CCMP2712]EKX38919.1 hypothetical protein GUITHDRAFT_115022 [Guillardia theta CCMP2712]|mmetsp:Transcript_49322/g.154719  ORF Transcript_49322/g.154719 Transcript_49322/m.154719 type:complete len:114 (-) Transcript_49322:93-434(-)|eukprot:XP_005825899.1 hypothetical protein GUITHDRAFT_115022 [Guillardia theta CCMP2712]
MSDGTEDASESAKVRALSECEEQHKKLLSCLKGEHALTSWSSWTFCTQESGEFWRCYEQSRGIKMTEQPMAIWRQTMQKMGMPSTLAGEKVQLSGADEQHKDSKQEGGGGASS